MLGQRPPKWAFCPVSGPSAQFRGLLPSFGASYPLFGPSVQFWGPWPQGRGDRHTNTLFINKYWYDKRKVLVQLFRGVCASCWARCWGGPPYHTFQPARLCDVYLATCFPFVITCSQLFGYFLNLRMSLLTVCLLSSTHCWLRTTLVHVWLNWMLGFSRSSLCSFLEGFL